MARRLLVSEATVSWNALSSKVVLRGSAYMSNVLVREGPAWVVTTLLFMFMNLLILLMFVMFCVYFSNVRYSAELLRLVYRLVLLHGRFDRCSRVCLRELTCLIALFV